MPEYEICDTNRLSLGLLDFSNLIESKMIYVDKTRLIFKIASQRTPIFFSRPRRFGKSLLVNTLSCLFAKGLDYFHGLDIEKLWHDITYKVVHFDFSEIADSEAQEFKTLLSLTIIKEFGLDYKNYNDYQELQYPTILFSRIIQKFNNNSIVLLIDEYDAPLIHQINDHAELQKITSILNKFYAIVKRYADKFRLIFITGVTRASHVSVFSAFNNLVDLSLNKEYNDLLGFTKNDIKIYFDHFVKNAAKVLQLSKSNVYDRLEQYYDGFQFALNAKETVYNPWSILNFFKTPQEGFHNYWFESGGTPSIIMNYLKIKDNFDFLDYSERNIFTEINKISRKYELTNIPQEILLFQAGYLTIRDEEDGTASLVLPNNEVEESLLLLYLEENDLIPSRKLKQKIKNLSDNIDSKKLPQIIDIFNSILNECVSSSSNIFNDERSVRDIIYAALIEIPSLQKIKERETVIGKADLELITDKTCLIIEFKRTYPTRGPEPSLKKAIEQIKNNRYGLLFSQTHEIYQVAMVISSSEKKILENFCAEVI